jgi:hypothetical protein
MAHLFAIFALLFKAALGKKSWHTSHPEWLEERRLEIATTTSHNDTAHDDCIVGGFDEDDPATIYVGGPCNQLDVSGASPQPLANFRYVKMSTVGISITNDEGDEADSFAVGAAVVRALEKSTHAEVTSGSHMAFEGFAGARLFASTTSFLSKGDFEFNENTFVTGENGGTFDEITMCVAPCCPSDSITSDGCDCSDNTCPTTNLKATKGTYKYSLLAGAYDDATAIDGINGDGWAKIKETVGTGTSGSKELEGHLTVYQDIDMTNMGASLTLTFSAANGDSVTYADMADCDLYTANGCPDSALYAGVQNIEVKAPNWVGTYSFPQSYNIGEWAEAVNGKTTTVAGTRKVKISVAKPAAANIVKWGLAANASEAAAMKMVVVAYEFDITGIDGSKTSGKWMVYDPDVQSRTMSTSPTGSGSSTGSGSASTASDARKATPLLALVSLVLLHI